MRHRITQEYLHLIAKSLSGLKWENIEAKTEEGSGKYVFIIITLLKDNNMP
jgi:hypothetical protein